MKYYVWILPLMLLLGCTTSGDSQSQNAATSVVDSTNQARQEIKDSIRFRYYVDSTYTYAQIKSQIKAYKQKIDTSSISSDSISRLFTHLILTKIFPYWYGTRWSFEGYTQVPASGEIACGYFVSITLRDMGFNLNIYKLAQQLPVNEARSLNLGKPYIEIENDAPEKNIDQLKRTLKDGLYFLGFDEMHVGYMLKSGNKIYLIHSNFIVAEGVVIEDIDQSQAFTYVNRIYVAEISNNTQLMKKWLRNETIYIVTE